MPAEVEPRLPSAPCPLVSVIVPARDNAELTDRCLARIAAVTEGEHYEVILVDDGSRLPLSASIATGGVQHLRREMSEGFVHACNDGAARARGRYLVFLNNDSLVEPGWLDYLVSRCASDASIGLVGAKLLNPDGTLQDFGGAVWRDGSGWNYGRGGDPNATEYRVLREPDYCSAAALLVRRAVFERLGGFDERFSPGYYEDTDLALGVRSLGFRVVVEPRALVIHLDGQTYGTDAPARKALMERNRARFAAKWGPALIDHAPVGAARGWVRGGAHRNPRVLLIDRTMPLPTRSAGSLRALLIARALLELGCQLSQVNTTAPRRSVETDRWEGMGIEVWTGVRVLDALVRVRGPIYDLVIVTWPDVADQVRRPLRRLLPNALLAFDTNDLHHVRLEDQRAWFGTPSERYVHEMKALELVNARRYDRTLVVSSAEAETLSNLVPTAIPIVVPLVHEDVGEVAALPVRDGVLFVGGFQHPPNVAAISWFLDAIWPLVRVTGASELTIVGPDLPAEIARRLPGRTRWVGHVTDLRPFYERTRLVVAPIPFGAGVRGKCVQALAHGVPLVSTTIGVAGLDVANGREVLIADDAVSFADAIMRLLRDDVLWQQLADRGRELARRSLSTAALREALAPIVRDAVAVARSNGDPLDMRPPSYAWPHGPSWAMAHEP